MHMHHRGYACGRIHKHGRAPRTPYIRWPLGGPSFKTNPMLTVRMQTLPDEHTLFHASLSQPSKLKSANVLMVADTGCQSSVILLRVAFTLGLEKGALIPVKLKMRGPKHEDLGILGVITVPLTVRDASGDVVSTRPLCYVSDQVDKTFLCREALTALRVIPENFPMPVSSTPVATTATAETSDKQTCSCPTRTKAPPPKLTSPPEGLAATEDNVNFMPCKNGY